MRDSIQRAGMAPVAALVALAGLGCAFVTVAAAASAPAVHGLTGTWNRYPQIDDQPDPKFPPPPPVGPPPLKPQYLGAWEAEQKAAKEADARGQPLYTDYVKCLPDGMPAMMQGMFPMEVLQTPGQVTIVQEA